MEHKIGEGVELTFGWTPKSEKELTQPEANNLMTWMCRYPVERYARLFT
jgi:hypothetical protein